MTTLLIEELREKVKEVAREHRVSWIQLGGYLRSVHQDKHYKTWGYLTFQAYCRGDLGMKDSVVSKLIKSYKFLEEEEPKLASRDYFSGDSDTKVPDQEAVHALRLAKGKKEIPREDFEDLKRDVFQEARDGTQVRQKIKRILDENEPDDPETRRLKRNQKLKRLVSMLSTLQREADGEKILPAYLLKQIDDLAEKIRHQIEE